MLTIEAATRDLAAAPALAKAGVVVMVLSGLADVIAHLEAHGPELTTHVHEHTGLELWAHLGGFLSMVLILLGVVIDGARRHRARRRPSAAPQQGDA
jgi:hypothetical protein